MALAANNHTVSFAPDFGCPKSAFSNTLTSSHDIGTPNFVSKGLLSTVLIHSLKKVDERVRVIEENQAKMANSLNRFLTKMNSVFFKGKCVYT